MGGSVIGVRCSVFVWWACSPRAVDLASPPQPTTAAGPPLAPPARREALAARLARARAYVMVTPE